VQLEGLNTNRLSHQYAAHSQKPVAQYDAQQGPKAHFGFHAHPLGVIHVLVFNFLQRKCYAIRPKFQVFQG
jgi:hypothetical protein